MDMKNIAICITAGEQSENHVGMQKNGNGLAEKGFSMDELKEFKKDLEKKSIDSEYYSLNAFLGDEKDSIEEAGLLIIRNGVEKISNNHPDLLLKEQMGFEWDKQYWDTRRKRVLNKIARYNLCYNSLGQEPDYENKKGRIISLENAPYLKKWRDTLSVIFGKSAENLELEGNQYYDVKKCGIGFHGDGERKKVIACSLGASRPIHWQWYQNSEQIGSRAEFMLNHGDMYIMSEKTTGYDWKKRSIKTLRHAAGLKYVK